MEVENVPLKVAAAEVGVAYITMMNYLHAQKLKGFKQGGRWKIPRDELDRFKKEGNLQRGK